MYILFSAKHGLNDIDKMMLHQLNEQCHASGGLRWTLQAVITKADELFHREFKNIRKIQEDILEAAPLCLPPILTAAEQPHFGIDNVRANIMEACGLGRAEVNIVRNTSSGP